MRGRGESVCGEEKMSFVKKCREINSKAGTYVVVKAEPMFVRGCGAPLRALGFHCSPFAAIS